MHILKFTLTVMSEQSLKDMQKLKSKCAAWLSASSPASIIDPYIEGKTPGTCEWIQTHPSYVAWNLVQPDAAPKERILQISGQSGCGKTMLACSIAQKLTEENNVVLFFSFSSTDANRQSLIDLARSFVWQLLQQSGSEQAFRIIEEFMSRGQPQLKDVWHALDRISAMGSSPLYWIVDGLDECEDSIGTVFEKLLAFNGQNKSRGIILGRQHAMEDLAIPTHIVKVTPDLVQTDISAYIRLAIDNSTILHMSSLQDVAFDRLYDGSQGMFLWVRFMIDDLCKPCSRAELKERLYSLPKGLHKAYVRTLTRLIEPLDSFDREFMKTVLALVISARRPLKVGELQHAVAMAQCASKQQLDAESLRDFMVEQFLERVRSVCGSLITIRHDILSLTHFSIQEFLTRPKSEWCHVEEQHLSFIRLDLGKSHFLFGSTCLDYLTIKDYKKSLDQSEQADLVDERPFLDYASGNMVYHLNRAGPVAENAFYDKFENFSASDAFLIWIRHLMTHSMGDDAAIWEITEACIFVFRLKDDHSRKRIFSQMAESVLGELEMQRELYGCDDWRIKQLSTIAGCFNLVVESHLSDTVEFFQDVSFSATDQKLINDGLELVESDMPFHKTTSRVFELMSVAGAIPSLPGPFQVAFHARRGLHLMKPLANPLDVLCNALLHNAHKLPTFILLGLDLYFHRLKRFQMALEVCQIALAKEKKHSGPLKCLAFGLKGDAEAELGNIADAECSQRQCVEETEKAFGREHMFTLGALSVWANRLDDVGNSEKSEEVLRRIIGVYEKMHDAKSKPASKDADGEPFEVPKLEYQYPKLAKLISLVARVPDTEVLESKFSLGFVLLERKKFSEAENLIRAVFNGRHRSLGDDDESTVSALKTLAYVLKRQNKYAEAESHYRNVIATETRKLGLKNETTLQSMRALGHVLREQKRYTDAEDVYRNVIETAKGALGELDIWVVHCTTDLGNAKFDQGHYEESAGLFREALEIAKSTSDIELKNTLIIEDRLGSALCNVEEYEKAAVSFRRVLSGRKDAFGIDHEAVIRSNRRLQRLLGQLKPNGDEIESLQRELVESSKRVHGEKSELTLNELVRFRGMLHVRGKMEELAEIDKQVLASKEAMLGTDSTATTKEAQLLGLSYEHLNRFQDAADLFSGLLESRIRVYGREHKRTARSMLCLGRNLLFLDKYKEAENLFHQALRIQRRLLGKDDEETVDAMYWLGRAMGEQNRWAEAAKRLKRSYDGHSRLSGRRNKFTLRIGAYLGLCYYKQGKYEEVVNLYRELAKEFRFTFGQRHRYTTSLELDMARALYQTGRYQEADDLSTELREIRCTKQEESEPSDLAITDDERLNSERKFQPKGRLDRSQSVGELPPTIARRASIQTSFIPAEPPDPSLLLSSNRKIRRMNSLPRLIMRDPVYLPTSPASVDSPKRPVFNEETWLLDRYGPS